MSTRTYYPPFLQAVTGIASQTYPLRFEFEIENCLYGVASIDAPLALPMGGVNVLYEDADCVMAKDFVSARAS